VFQGGKPGGGGGTDPIRVGMPGGGGGRGGIAVTSMDCEGSLTRPFPGGGPSGIGISSSLVTSSVPGGSSSARGTSSSSKVVIRKKSLMRTEKTPHTLRICITVYFTG
jgi:hypothetical protein